MIKTELEAKLNNGELDEKLASIYGEKALAYQKSRYLKLASRFEKETGKDDFSIFSTAGRTELMGNHTDHNHGCVLAASVQMDTLACTYKRDDSIVEILSEGYPQAIIDLTELENDPSEKETTISLIRGIAARFKQLGYKIGGYTAVTTSDVPGGSGLSSSAAIEVLIGTIFSHLYNEGTIDPVELAKIGQWSENNFFGKPCGLMDQIACGYGGIVKIDFKDPSAPEVESINYNFKKAGYTLIVVNTGGSHADLTDEYAAVPGEMKKVAALFNKKVLRGLTQEEIVAETNLIREKAGDRAYLRALHFINENLRPQKAVDLLKKNKINDYLKVVQESGLSSWRYLQNCTSIKDVEHQGVTTALAIAEVILGDSGCYRVHGGGFAGTIQAYVPNAKTELFKSEMGKVFGAESVTELKIRQLPTTKIL